MKLSEDDVVTVCDVVDLIESCQPGISTGRLLSDAADACSEIYGKRFDVGDVAEALERRQKSGD